MILDSVLPPQVNLVEQGWASAASSYKAIFDGCDADAACASAFPDVQSEFIKLVNDLSVKPRTVTIVDPMTGKKTDAVIDGYKLASGIVVSASQTHGYLQKIPALIDNLANGDGTQAANTLRPTWDLRILLVTVFSSVRNAVSWWHIRIWNG